MELILQIDMYWAKIKTASIYLFKVSNGNTRKLCEICSKFTRKAPKRRYLRRSGVFIISYEQISHIK